MKNKDKLNLCVEICISMNQIIKLKKKLETVKKPFLKLELKQKYLTEVKRLRKLSVRALRLLNKQQRV